MIMWDIGKQLYYCTLCNAFILNFKVYDFYYSRLSDTHYKIYVDKIWTASQFFIQHHIFFKKNIIFAECTQKCVLTYFRWKCSAFILERKCGSFHVNKDNNELSSLVSAHIVYCNILSKCGVLFICLQVYHNLRSDKSDSTLFLFYYYAQRSLSGSVAKVCV